jgi:hypothetical protein
MRAWLRWARNPVAAAALIAGVLAAGAGPAAAGRVAPLTSLGTTSITVNPSGGDQTFMGIGAILGGGGNARYLMDYPQQQRDDILKYLFKRDYGASLQILKLEIGGGANSTDGSEASIEPVAGQTPNCNAGYEFAIAKQAVTLNPDIKLYGLQWSAPGWVSAGVSPASVLTGSYSPTTGPSGDIKYLIDWLNCATNWGLTISYLGGWNESSGANGFSGNYSWYSDLRAALDAAGYQNVQLIAGDLNPTWEYASSASPNPFPAISILGTHDVCGYPTELNPTDVCNPPEVVVNGTSQPINTPQPLWASELGAMDGTTLSNCDKSPQFPSGQSCADAMDRALVRGYYETRLNGNNRGDPGLTGYLEWPAVDAMPAAGVGGCIDEATQVLPHEDQGLITADQPWQGHYCVNAMTWAIAHFTQFVSPPDASNPGGWKYEDTSTGYLLGTSADGSYVTFIKSGGADWTTVIEATKAPANETQTLKFTVTGGLATKPVYVWSSDFSLGSPASSRFTGPTTIQPNSSGQFSLTVQPGYVYTLTTTTGQSKGNAGTAPAAASFPLPYPPSNICPLSSPPNDSLACSGNAGSNDDEASYLAAQDGSFELKPCVSPPPDGSTTCTEQTTAPRPVLWPYAQDETTIQPRYPYAIIGDTWMTNYTVSADVLLTKNNTSAGLIARFDKRAKDSVRDHTSVGMFAGYVFDVTTAGVWKLFKNTPTGQSTVQSDTIAALGTGTWHHLALQVSGTTVTASVDGTQIVSWTDASTSPYSSGLAGIEAGAFGNTWADVQYSNLKIISA